MAMIMIIVGFALVTLAGILAYKYRSFRNEINQIAGPPVSSIIVGNLNLFFRRAGLSTKEYMVDLFRVLLDLTETYRSQGAFRLWAGPFHSYFVLTNAQSVEKLLSSTVNLNKGKEYRFMAPWLGDGLLLADSSKWRSRRKLLTPAFHFKILENFIPIFERQTNLLLTHIETACEDGHMINDIRPLFEDLTLRIINETSMGIVDGDVHTAKESESESYREALKNGFRFATHRLKHPLYWFDFIYRFTRYGKKFYQYVHTMHRYTDKIIAKRMNDFKEKIKAENGEKADPAKRRESATKKETIFLDILLEKYFFDNTNGAINATMMRSEVNTFILGGHDTTAMALTFAALLIGWHADVHDQIDEEMRDIFGDDIVRPITTDDLKQMRYLEACIKETLRLYPSIQVIGRRLTQPLTLPNGISIDAGYTCYVPIISIHLDPSIYPDPKRFDPDRFSNESNHCSNNTDHQPHHHHHQQQQQSDQRINPYAYIPFSAGPRNCIGQKYALLELKYILAAIFRRYRIRSYTKTETIVREVTPVLKPVDAIKISFHRRHGAIDFESPPLGRNETEQIMIDSPNDSNNNLLNC